MENTQIPAHVCLSVELCMALRCISVGGLHPHLTHPPSHLNLVIEQLQRVSTCRVYETSLTRQDKITSSRTSGDLVRSLNDDVCEILHCTICNTDRFGFLQEAGKSGVESRGAV